MPPREAQLNYRLPSTIQSIQDGWQITCQSSAIMSALLAVVSTLLLDLPKDLRNLELSHPSQRRSELALALLSYASLILNISACLSSLTLLDQLGELPFRAAQKRQSFLPSAGAIEGTSEDLLRRYGVYKLWNVLVWHWLVSYILGIVAILAQTALYVWMQEQTAVKAVVTFLCGFAVLPILLMCSVPWFSKQESGPDSRRRPLSYADPLPMVPNISSFTLAPNPT